MPRQPQISLQHRVLRYIREHELMRPGDRVGVAVSGGADSVALLRLLLELREDLGVVFSVIHINHCLRGAESDADQAFAAQLAQQFGVEAYIECADALKHSKERNISIEAAGHELRHVSFATIGVNHQLKSVATAHTLDDQAETVLLKLMRGAWTRGLAGIYPIVQFGATALIRPLLNVRRAELREYLTALNQPWCEDQTNKDVSFTRNRIRHELLPLLERDYHPAIAELLSGTSELARAEQQFWELRVMKLWEECTNAISLLPGGGICWRFDLERFRRLSLAEQRRAVESALHDIVRVEFRHVEAARLAILAGKRVTCLPHGWDLTFDGEVLTLARRLGPPEPQD